MINDLVIKPFYVQGLLRQTFIYPLFPPFYYFSETRHWSDSTWYLNGIFFLIYMHIYFLSKRKWPRRTKNILHDLVMYNIYLLYRGKWCQSIKPLLLIWYEKRKTSLWKLFILICVWCLTCWDLSTNVSLFVFCLFVSRQVCQVIHYSCTIPRLDFCHCQVNYNSTACICLFRMAQLNIYWIIKIYYHIYCLSQRPWLWNLIPTPMCKSYACQIFFMSILNGFIPLVKVSFLVLLSL